MRKKIERSRSLKQYNKWKTKVEQNSGKRSHKAENNSEILDVEMNGKEVDIGWK